MEELIDSYAGKFTFPIFQEIYRLLEIMDKESEDVNLLNKEYVGYCGQFAKNLLKNQRFR